MTSCFTHFTVAVYSALIHIAAETINHFKLTPFSNAKKKKSNWDITSNNTTDSASHKM